MFDVNTKTKLFENPSFRFDNEVFQIYIVLVEKYWFDFSAGEIELVNTKRYSLGFTILLSFADLFNMFKHGYHISNPPRGLFDFGRAAQAAHRSHLHGLPHERLAEVEPVEKHLSSGHSNLYIKKQR